MRYTKLSLLTLVLLAVGLVGCSDESSLVGADEGLVAASGDGLAANASTTAALETVQAISYDAKNSQYVVVGLDESGDIDLYVGTPGNWTQQQENRDPGQGDFTAVTVTGLASDANGGAVVVGDDPNYKTGFRQYAPRCVAKGAYDFYGKPRFGGGQNKAVGDLVTCSAISYDAQNGQFIVLGRDENGDTDLYVGTPGNWTQQQENRDPGQGDFTRTTFVALATNTSGNTLAFANDPNYKTGFRQYAERCVTSSAYDFYGKPRFGGGRTDGKAVGDLKTCIDASYDAKNSQYVVVGLDESGDIDLYVGTPGNWTQQQENRDPGQGDFTAVTVTGLASDANGGAVVVGDDPNYKTGFRQYAPRGVAKGAYDFYGKPRFGGGQNKVIGS